jgi:sialic acid synthase SpsE
MKKKMNFEKLTKKKTYFIADIAANHDGSLARAKKLIKLCAQAGANAAKFQHFKAETIVSDYGFEKMKKLSHHKKWKKSVFEVYKKASIDPKWNSSLSKECKKYNIDYMTAPYDLEYVVDVKNYISAYKIGSGDITWKKILIKIAKQKKPIILATGASNFDDVKKAVKTIQRFNKIKMVLMQCNTNYTNSIENFSYLNLNVLNQYKNFFKNKIILGLSDHTPGHQSVMGAISMGAKVIEKHFTDSNYRKGPDHKFSMNPKTWFQMVRDVRLLEQSLGDGKKKIEKNEKESVIIQRRGAWLNKDVQKGESLTEKMIDYLRPSPKNSIDIFEIKKIIGKKFRKSKKKNSLITSKCLMK